MRSFKAESSNVHEITGLRPDREERTTADSVACPDKAKIQRAVSKSELIEALELALVGYDYFDDILLIMVIVS